MLHHFTILLYIFYWQKTVCAYYKNNASNAKKFTIFLDAFCLLLLLFSERGICDKKVPQINNKKNMAMCNEKPEWAFSNYILLHQALVCAQALILLTPCSPNTNMPEEGKRGGKWKRKTWRNILLGESGMFWPSFLDGCSWCRDLLASS